MPENQKIKTPEEMLNLSENKIFKDRMDKYNEIISNHSFLKKSNVNEAIDGIRLDLKGTLDFSKDNIEIYSDVMNKIIQHKETVAHLSNRAFADYKITSSAYNNLCKQWVGVFSSQKSNEKREGEAHYLLSKLYDIMIGKEIIYENLKRMSFNLSSEADIISRKITLIQLNASLDTN